MKLGLISTSLLLLSVVSPCRAIDRSDAAPVLSVRDALGRRNLGKAELYRFEHELLARLMKRDAPNEIFSAAIGRPADFISRVTNSLHLITVEVYDQCSVVRITSPELTRSELTCTMPASFAEKWRRQISSLNIEDLPSISHSTQSPRRLIVVNHIQEDSGCRVEMINPITEEDEGVRTSDALRPYSHLFRLFESLKDQMDLQQHYVLTVPVSELTIVHDRRDGPARYTWIETQRMGVVVDKGREHLKLAAESGELVETGPNDPISAVREIGHLTGTIQSADGRFAVGIRRTDHQVECVDMASQAIVRLPDGLASCIPLAYLESSNEFLLGRAISFAGGRVEWKVKKWHPSKSVVREFVPVGDMMQVLISSVGRPFQHVGQDRKLVWAAIPGTPRQSTRYGIFDIESMEWLTSSWIADLEFSSADMLVDKEDRVVFLVHCGNVLRFPLSKWEYDAKSD